MANPEHVEIVKQGAIAIATWRVKNPNIRFELSEADLRNANLEFADLSGADLRGANMECAVLCEADFCATNLDGANLARCDFGGADLSFASACNANFCGAQLDNVILNDTKMREANVEKVLLGYAVVTDVELSTVKGLESVEHVGPSSIGIDTLYKSQGKIPEIFLRGCGVPEALITYLPSLIGAMEPIQFQSCFISYSSKDDEFARRLYDKMLGSKLNVYFAPEDMRGGKKSIEQLYRAIEKNDRLLLVLSKHSMNSEWVRREIKRARATERVEKRQKLFPIRLVSFDRIRDWRCDDADTGEDLAEKIREYHIPDFSNWKDHDAFQDAFADLLRDLRDEAKNE